jgi:hypothetical protein
MQITPRKEVWNLYLQTHSKLQFISQDKKQMKIPRLHFILFFCITHQFHTLILFCTSNSTVLHSPNNKLTSHWTYLCVIIHHVCILPQQCMCAVQLVNCWILSTLVSLSLYYNMVQEIKNFCYQTKNWVCQIFFWKNFIFKVKISSPKFLITYQMVYLKLPAGRRKLVTAATNTATFV